MRLNLGLMVAVLAGVLIAAGVVAFVGVRPTVQAVRSIGLVGFLVFSAIWAGLISLLGCAWWAGASPTPPALTGRFVWGRWVREGAADLLPFSQLGALVIGVRLVVQSGVDEALVFASTLVDLTTELLAQLVYTLIGVGLLASRMSGGAAQGRALVGVLTVAALGAGVTFAFVAFQRRGVGVVGWLARRWLPDIDARAAAVQVRLKAMYRDRARIAAAVGLHTLGWLVSGAASYVALRFMGAPVSLLAVVAVESLTAAVKSFGFAVPAGLGVQEAAYVAIGPLFGVPSDLALGLSLIKRAREVVSAADPSGVAGGRGAAAPAAAVSLTRRSGSGAPGAAPSARAG